jgi:hypothetical protein
MHLAPTTFLPVQVFSAAVSPVPLLSSVVQQGTASVFAASGQGQCLSDIETANTRQPSSNTGSAVTGILARTGVLGFGGGAVACDEYSPFAAGALLLLGGGVAAYRWYSSRPSVVVDRAIDGKGFYRNRLFNAAIQWSEEVQAYFSDDMIKRLFERVSLHNEHWALEILIYAACRGHDKAKEKLDHVNHRDIVQLINHSDKGYSLLSALLTLAHGGSDYARQFFISFPVYLINLLRTKDETTVESVKWFIQSLEISCEEERSCWDSLLNELISLAYPENSEPDHDDLRDIANTLLQSFNIPLDIPQHLQPYVESLILEVRNGKLGCTIHLRRKSGVISMLFISQDTGETLLPFDDGMTLKCSVDPNNLNLIASVQRTGPSKIELSDQAQQYIDGEPQIVNDEYPQKVRIVLKDEYGFRDDNDELTPSLSVETAPEVRIQAIYDRQGDLVANLIYERKGEVFSIDVQQPVILSGAVEDIDNPPIVVVPDTANMGEMAMTSTQGIGTNGINGDGVAYAYDLDGNLHMIVAAGVENEACVPEITEFLLRILVKNISTQKGPDVASDALDKAIDAVLRNFQADTRALITTIERPKSSKDQPSAYFTSIGKNFVATILRRDEIDNADEDGEWNLIYQFPKDQYSSPDFKRGDLVIAGSGGLWVNIGQHTANLNNCQTAQDVVATLARAAHESMRILERAQNSPKDAMLFDRGPDWWHPRSMFIDKNGHIYEVISTSQGFNVSVADYQPPRRGEYMNERYMHDNLSAVAYLHNPTAN